MKEKSILNKIKTVLGIEVKLEQMKLDNGTVVEADSFEAGAEIFVVSDTERIPLPMGDYKMEDGRALIIAQDGVIGEIKDVQAPETPAPVAAEEAKPAAKKVVESISKETHFTKEEMLSEIDKLRKEFNEKLEGLKLSKEKEVELEVEPIKHSPEAEVSKKEPILYSQNRTFGTKELVFKKLFNN